MTWLRHVSINLWDLWWSSCWPVMLILADHLDVPSKTLCLTCFIWVTWVVLGTPNTSWMSSKISGLFLSRIFMRSLRTMIMFWVRSSAPCLELFSAAPERKYNKSDFRINSPVQAGQQTIWNGSIQYSGSVERNSTVCLFAWEKKRKERWNGANKRKLR